jgi:hypothetical protein
VDKQVFISRSKHKAAAELQRVLTQAMLLVSCGLRASAGLHVVSPQKMEQGSMAQAHSFIRCALVVNQERELDAAFFSEEAGILGVSQADHGQPRTLLLELFFKFAQLRDMLSAEDSAIMPKKNHHRRPALP